MRLNLGCGQRILEGYVNVDMNSKADVRCNILELPDEWEGKASEILVIHVFEHLAFYQSRVALMEWKRVLCPGGILIVECPNLKEACLSFLKNPEEKDRGINCLYGEQSPGDILSVHKSGWTPESLIKEMQIAGFREARQMPAQFKRKEPRDFRVEGVK